MMTTVELRRVIQNALSYFIARTKEKTRHVWEFFDHPPYSADLVPSDYFLFLKLKQSLDAQRFEDDEEFKTAVVNWFNEVEMWSSVQETKTVNEKVFWRILLTYLLFEYAS